MEMSSGCVVQLQPAMQHLFPWRSLEEEQYTETPLHPLEPTLNESNKKVATALRRSESDRKFFDEDGDDDDSMFCGSRSASAPPAPYPPSKRSEMGYAERAACIFHSIQGRYHGGGGGYTGNSSTSENQPPCASMHVVKTNCLLPTNDCCDFNNHFSDGNPESMICLNDSLMGFAVQNYEQYISTAYSKRATYVQTSPPTPGVSVPSAYKIGSHFAQPYSLVPSSHYHQQEVTQNISSSSPHHAQVVQVQPSLVSAATASSSSGLSGTRATGNEAPIAKPVAVSTKPTTQEDGVELKRNPPLKTVVDALAKDTISPSTAGKDSIHGPRLTAASTSDPAAAQAVSSAACASETIVHQQEANKTATDHCRPVHAWTLLQQWNEQQPVVHLTGARSDSQQQGYRYHPPSRTLVKSVSVIGEGLTHSTGAGGEEGTVTTTPESSLWASSSSYSTSCRVVRPNPVKTTAPIIYSGAIDARLGATTSGLPQPVANISSNQNPQPIQPLASTQKAGSKSLSEDPSHHALTSKSGSSAVVAAQQTAHATAVTEKNFHDDAETKRAAPQPSPVGGRGEPKVQGAVAAENISDSRATQKRRPGGGINTDGNLKHLSEGAELIARRQKDEAKKRTQREHRLQQLQCNFPEIYQSMPPATRGVPADGEMDGQTHTTHTSQQYPTAQHDLPDHRQQQILENEQQIRTNNFRLASGTSTTTSGGNRATAMRSTHMRGGDDDDGGSRGLNHQPTPLFERLVTEEVQELKAYARIIENQNRRLADLERVHGDLEARLESESRERQQLEATLEMRERQWTQKFRKLEEDRDNWKSVVQAEQAKNSRLIDQVVRKDQDIHRMLQRKYDYDGGTAGRPIRNNVRGQPGEPSSKPGSVKGSPQLRSDYHKSPHEILAASGSAEKVRLRNVKGLLLDFFGM